ncbi:neuropeptide FF receptor 1, partial [Biomphalaria glabrata]
MSGSNALEALKISAVDVTSLYRLENPYTWFLVPISGRLRERLTGKSFENETFKIEVISIEEERTKITLHWVSPAIAKRRVVEIFQCLAEEGSMVEVTQIGTSDKWVSSIK